jgi:hypothetical protein
VLAALARLLTAKAAVETLPATSDIPAKAMSFRVLDIGASCRFRGQERFGELEPTTLAIVLHLYVTVLESLNPRHTPARLFRDHPSGAVRSR